MRWIIGVGLLNLCGCHFNRSQFIVDPYLVELSSRFINIQQLTKLDGYKLTVLELDDHEKLKKMTSKGRPTIVSPLLGLTIESEVESDAVWLLKDNEAPYIFNYVDAEKLVGFSLGGDSSSLVVYVDEKDKEMIESSGLLGDNVLYHHLDESIDYKALFRRYAARGFDNVIVMQRNFPIDIDAIIIDEGLNKETYITDRLSKSHYPYYFLAKDYDRMMQQFKKDKEKRVYNYLYLIK